MEKLYLIVILSILSCCEANENYNQGRRRNLYNNKNYASPLLNYNYMDGSTNINPADTSYNQGQIPTVQSSYSNFKTYEYDSGKTSQNRYKNKVKQSRTNGAWIPGAGFIPGYPFTYLKDSYNGHSPTGKTYNNDYISQNSYNGDSMYDTAFNDSYTYPSSTTSNDQYSSSSSDPYFYSSSNNPYYYQNSNDPYYNPNSNDPYLYSFSNDPYVYSSPRLSNNLDSYLTDPIYYSASSISKYPNFYSIPANPNNIYAYSAPVSPNNAYSYSAPVSLINQYSYLSPATPNDRYTYSNIPNYYSYNSNDPYTYTNPSNMNKVHVSFRPYTPYDKHIYSSQYTQNYPSSYSVLPNSNYLSSYVVPNNPNIYSDPSTTSYSDPYFYQYPMNSNVPFVPYDPNFNSISANVYYDDLHTHISPVTEFQYNKIQDYNKYPSTVSPKLVRATPYLNYGYSSRNVPRYYDYYGNYNNNQYKNKKSSAMNYRRGYYKK